MLKKDMKNIFGNLYIFSKLIVTLILLACLISVLYILYVNYQNQSNLSKTNLNIESEIQENINKNSSLIKDISKEIKLTQSALINIEKKLNTISANEKKEDFSKLSKGIETLNKNFNALSQEIENMKTEPSINMKNSPEIINNSYLEIIDIVLLKYENNLSFENEIEFLKKNIETGMIPVLEKITILENIKYKGHLHLQQIFDQETSSYLKKIINEDSDSLFNRIILPYLDILPTTENLVTDDFILKVKEIKKNIENKNIEKAFDTLKNIKDYGIIFEISMSEMKTYLDFKTQILKLKE